MDEKTAELRDLFINTTGSETVTENQEETPGSLTDERKAASERVPALISMMRDRYTFESTLSDDDIEAVVRGYYDEQTDTEIADAISAERAEVFTARMDLHLVRDSDRDAPFKLATLRRLLVEDRTIEECAAELERDIETVTHYVAVATADIESTRANDRFRDEFRELLTDSDLEQSHARTAREDGLRDATEDLETDVSF